MRHARALWRLLRLIGHVLTRWRRAGQVSTGNGGRKGRGGGTGKRSLTGHDNETRDEDSQHARSIAAVESGGAKA